MAPQIRLFTIAAGGMVRNRCGSRPGGPHFVAMRFFISSVLATFLFVVMLSSGCEDKRRHSASTGLSLAKSPAPLPADAPPDQVAETLLKAIVTAQRSEEQ